MLKFNLGIMNMIFWGFCRVPWKPIRWNICFIRLEEITQPHTFPPVFPVFIISIISVLSGRERGREQPDLYKFSTDAVVRNVFVLQGPAQKRFNK